MRERQSNIELLRLVSMFMIVIGHFVYHGIMTRSVVYPTQTGWDAFGPVLIHALCLCAVNTFVLISGYFSIRPKAKSFFNIYFIVAFYACIMYLVHLYVIGAHLNRWALYNTIMPFGLWHSSTEWWFMPNYLLLFIVSPILNKAIDAMTKREMQVSLLLLGIVIFYFGWYRNMEWSQGGFNFVQFVFMYFIGRYLSLHTMVPQHGWRWGIGWLIGSIIIATINFYKPMDSPFVWYINAYNSPLTVLAAVCLFNTFRSMPIKNNRVINWFAASALAIYLLHDCAYFRDFLYGAIADIYDTHTLFVTYAMLFGLGLCIMICAPCVDKIRILITNPLVKYSTILYEKIKVNIICHH